MDVEDLSALSWIEVWSFIDLDVIYNLLQNLTLR